MTLTSFSSSSQPSSCRLLSFSLTKRMSFGVPETILNHYLQIQEMHVSSGREDCVPIMVTLENHKRWKASSQDLREGTKYNIWGCRREHQAVWMQHGMEFIVPGRRQTESERPSAENKEEVSPSDREGKKVGDIRQEDVNKYLWSKSPRSLVPQQAKSLKHPVWIFGCLHISPDVLGHAKYLGLSYLV